MIKTFAVTKTFEKLTKIPLERLKKDDILWYWVDFHMPTEDEIELLNSFFHFHPLSIEDCLQYVQRPKLNHYREYSFFVFHYLNKKLEAEEVDIFLGENFIVSFHKEQLSDDDEIYNELLKDENIQDRDSIYVLHSMIDLLVDDYFPLIYKLEDRITELEENENGLKVKVLMDEIFKVRKELIRLRKTIVPMRDLLYRMINSSRIDVKSEHHVYFTDIYDHLSKQAEMIQTNWEYTADIRDNYISINGNHMNSIMMTLTVITTIFMPLTFIAGLYGMNFDNMPELHTKYGYFICLGVMALIGGCLYIWFKRKGWFDGEK